MTWPSCGAGASAQDITDSAVAQQGGMAINNNHRFRHRPERLGAQCHRSSGAIVQNGGNAIGTVTTGAASIVSGAGSNGQSGYVSSGSRTRAPARQSSTPVWQCLQRRQCPDQQWQRRPVLYWPGSTRSTTTRAGRRNTRSGVAVGQVNQSPINVGAGNSGLQNTPGPANLDQGSGSAQQQTGGGPNSMANGANSSANSGNIASGNTVTGGTNTQTVTSTTPGLNVQTVALTTLQQVNSGNSIGNGNTLYGSGAIINANSHNSSSNGVLATSASIGVAANSAAQNVVNVSANINHP